MLVRQLIISSLSCAVVIGSRTLGNLSPSEQTRRPAWAVDLGRWSASVSTGRAET